MPRPAVSVWPLSGSVERDSLFSTRYLKCSLCMSSQVISSFSRLSKEVGSSERCAVIPFLVLISTT